MSYQKIMLLAVLMALQMPAQQIARILRISTESVRTWRIKFDAIERAAAASEVAP